MSTNSNTSRRTASKRLRSEIVEVQNDSDSECELSSSSAPLSEFTWPRFLVIRSKDRDRPAKNIHPFLVGKVLQSTVGRPVAKKMKEDLLVEVDSKRKSEALQRIKTIGETHVEVFPHRSLNSSKGVIHDEALSQLSEEELVKHLSSQGVTSVKRFHFMRDNKKVYTRTVILTFGLPSPPEKIWAGFYFLKVKMYIPFPLRCYGCQRFGHGQARCEKPAVCVRCGAEDHIETQCNTATTPSCVNCAGQHAASSKQCPRWIEECGIQKLKAEEKLSFSEARRKYKAMNGHVDETKQTYAQATSTRRSMTTIGTQTFESTFRESEQEKEEEVLSVWGSLPESHQTPPAFSGARLEEGVSTCSSSQGEGGGTPSTRPTNPFEGVRAKTSQSFLPRLSLGARGKALTSSAFRASKTQISKSEKKKHDDELKTKKNKGKPKGPSTQPKKGDKSQSIKTSNRYGPLEESDMEDVDVVDPLNSELPVSPVSSPEKERVTRAGSSGPPDDKGMDVQT